MTMTTARVEDAAYRSDRARAMRQFERAGLFLCRENDSADSAHQCGHSVILAVSVMHRRLVNVL